MVAALHFGAKLGTIRPKISTPLELFQTQNSTDTRIYEPYKDFLMVFRRWKCVNKKIRLLQFGKF